MHGLNRAAPQLHPVSAMRICPRALAKIPCLEFLAVAGVAFALVGACAERAEASPFMINLLVPEKSSGGGSGGGGETPSFGWGSGSAIAAGSLSLPTSPSVSGSWYVAGAPTAIQTTPKLVPASGGPVAETVSLSLGSGDYLTVSGAVADSIFGASSSTPVATGGAAGTSSSDISTASVVNGIAGASDAVVGSGSSSGLPESPAGGGSPGVGITTVLPDLAADVVPGLVDGIVSPVGGTATEGGSSLTSGLSPVAAVENPEPASLLLLASGLALIARRVRRPKR